MALQRYDVGIVGCGPTGLSLGVLLAHRGVSVGMVDRLRHAVATPRATHIDDEVVRIFQALGVAEEMEPSLYLPSTYEFFDQDWNKFLEFHLSSDVGDQGWCGDYMFHQPDFEARLRGLLNASGDVDLHEGWDVTRTEQREDHVLVEARAVDGDAHLAFEARYVVGCDGARSIVREMMGATLDDLHGTQRWLVTDVLLDEQATSVPERLFSYCPPLPGRAVTFITTGTRRRRTEFKLKPDDDPRELERPDVVWALLEPYIRRDQGELERADVYQFNALLARQWRAGRLFLAGDAAHQMPPKAGQGLCSGFRDAMNLGWKLAYCLRVPEADVLLDTYESERRPHAEHWITTSNALAKSIEEMNFGPDAEAGAPHDGDPGAGDGPPPRPRLGPGLHGDFSHGGELSTQTFCADGSRLDDVVGGGWALIAAPELLESLDARSRGVWERLGAVVLTPQQARYEQWLESRGTQAAIIRPDRYLLGVAGSAVELELVTSHLAEVLRVGSVARDRVAPL